MAHSEAEIKKHLAGYWKIYFALLFLTGVTVGVSYIDFGSEAMAILVGLFVACIKGFLVACYFMHLIEEKKMIFLTLIMTVFFFGVLMLLPLFTDMDRIVG